MAQTPIILIVEPNALFRRALTRTIRSRFPELSVIETDSAEEALKKSVSLKPQLVLMDIRLGNGGTQGLDLIRRIAVSLPFTRIAVLTDSDDEAYRKAAFGKGADFFISKTRPNEGKKVLTIIQMALLEA